MTDDKASPPDFLQASGWQRSDETHPADGGRPAYRVVYRTAKVVLLPASVEWPNLTISFGHGNVDIGGMVLDNAIPTRHPGRRMLVDEVEVVEAGGDTQVRYVNNMNVGFRAWQEEVKGVFHTEFVVEVPTSDPRGALVQGRRLLAPLLTSLDLRFGQRLLAFRLCEEVGEMFDDGHFNRRVVSEEIGMEAQLDVEAIDPREFLAWSADQVGPFQERSAQERRRIRLACEWYWQALHEEDPALSYIGFFTALEALLMPSTSNVRPAKEFFAKHCGGDIADYAFIGSRHQNTRSKILHGDIDPDVARELVVELRLLVECALDIELEIDNSVRIEGVRSLAGTR